MGIPQTAIRGVVGLAVACATIMPVEAPASAATQEARPVLSLRAASTTVTLERFGGSVFLDLGVMAVAGDEPFEIHLGRRTYAHPIVATWMRGSQQVALDDVELDNFNGFPRFFRIVVQRPDDSVVLNRLPRFCPNGFDTVRLRPGAPATSPYPRRGCPWNAYTRGSVWGIQAGWGAGISQFRGSFVRLAPGRYRATVSITRPYRQLFGLTVAASRRTVRIRVVDGEGCVDCPHLSGGDTDVPHQPAAEEPTGNDVVPVDTPLPDLRSLPAFGIGIDSRPATGHEFVSFGANVWNAGESPLVVDGFRRRHEALMDAYQYFFDIDGNQVGFARVGAMEWDARRGHHHWHFKDFARYRLLDASKTAVVRSRKEAFCLANTDAVDYTVDGANWNPDGTDLHTSCGGATSLAVREVLDSGSGDTYFQGLPGQSFDITSLPNGVYYIEVTANPAQRLHESSVDNNVSYRKVVLGGTPGARTVRAAQVGIVEEPPFGGF